ncbi:hypothetical protein [Herpetosiphon gulosus]|uniref:Uncharacterized protein n=1 Tax=Herpetosiphon gulosus TaxID=1973496 RepID=A0ABP9X820_9CHLR
MILDIPSKQEFEDAGTNFLNLAWDAVIQRIIDLEDSDFEQWDTDGTVSDEYWNASQKSLTMAVSLVQQGVEFLLKSRIVNVSPFLIIAGDSRDWPRGCDKSDLSFADFRTIDAQDLIRVHNTVSSVRLEDNFKDFFNDLRSLRNRIMHTVDKKARARPEQVIVYILEVSNELLSPLKWIPTRINYLLNNPIVVIHTSDHVDAQLTYEILLVIDMLKPADRKKYFGLTKQRRYMCPICLRNCTEMDIYPDLAQLQPNTPSSTTLYCIVCQKTIDVKRIDCQSDNCKGNVISHNDMCLTCGAGQA